jgi:uncharacterized repeat protein (TIGR04076 family)
MKAPYRVEVKVTKQEGECPFGHRVGDVTTFDGEGMEGKICWHSLCSMMYKIHGLLYGADYSWLDRNVARRPRLVGGQGAQYNMTLPCREAPPCGRGASKQRPGDTSLPGRSESCRLRNSAS